MQLIQVTSSQAEDSSWAVPFKKIHYERCFQVGSVFIGIMNRPMEIIAVEKKILMICITLAGFCVGIKWPYSTTVVNPHLVTVVEYVLITLQS